MSDIIKNDMIYVIQICERTDEQNTEQQTTSTMNRILVHSQIRLKYKEI